MVLPVRSDSTLNETPETVCSLEHPASDDDVKNDEKKSRDDPVYALAVGQQVDVLDSAGRWAEAEILKVDKENSRIFVTYIYWSSRWDAWIEDIHDRVAPLNTHTYYEGGPYKEGQRIEAYHFMTKRWLEAFILSVTDAQVRVHYRGHAISMDEWIPFSRIRPFGRHKNLPEKPRLKQWTVSKEQERIRAIVPSTDRYTHYVSALSSHGYVIHNVPGDGNCLFRAISHQLYGTDAHHDIVRQKCLDYMEMNASFFSQFVIGGAELFPVYIAAKRKNGCWGDDPEIQAICEMYHRPAHIWAYDPTCGARKLRTFHEGVSSSGGSPICLSYYGGGHYDSLCTPHSTHLSTAPGVMEDSSIAAKRLEDDVDLDDDVESLLVMHALTSSVDAKTTDDDISHALQQSEAEYMEKAIQDSLVPPDSDHHTELALLEHAKQASLQEAAKPADEDMELKRALEISKMSDDEILQQVLAESMRQAEGNAASFSDAHIPEDYDEELEMAIRASYRDI